MGPLMLHNQKGQQVLERKFARLLGSPMEYPSISMISFSGSKVEPSLYSFAGKESGNCGEGSFIDLTDV